GVVCRGAALGGVTGPLRQHVIEFGHLKLRVPDQRVGDGIALGLLDVLHPARVVVDRVDAKPDDLAIAPLELRHQPRHVAELGCTDRREILRMGEQNRHPSPIHSWKLTVPWVVSAVKSGTSELILNDMMPLPRLIACESWSGTWSAADIPCRHFLLIDPVVG